MDTKKYTYINIPLPFIRPFVVAPRKVKDVVKYSIYLSAFNVMRRASHNDLHEACRAALDETIKEGNVPDSIKHQVTECIPGLQMNDEKVQRLVDMADVNTELCNSLIEWYAVRMECNRLGIMMDDVDTFRNIFWAWNMYDLDVSIFASVRFAILQRYIRQADKADIPLQERAQMACFLAIKSIIGREAYTFATQDFILARMAGCRDINKAAEFLRNTQKEELKQMYEKYSQREQFNKLLEGLLRLRFLRCCVFNKENDTYLISTKLAADEIADKESCRLGPTSSIKEMTKTYYRTILTKTKQKQK